MGLLSALFPGPAAAGKVVDAATKGIDALFYTEQEKAEDKQKAKAQAASMFLRYMEATSGQNRARRAIALVVTGLWASTWAAAVLLDVAAPWVGPDYGEPLRLSTQSLKDAAGEMNGPFTIILGFYFGQRLLDAFRESRQAKPEK